MAYPQHDVRKASKRYQQTHDHLINVLDAPCWICGVRKSEGAELETHHAHFEWACQNGLDLEKVMADWPEITDQQKLADWIDSEANMMVLCAVHHRGQTTGVHMISYPAWLLQRYQGTGWVFVEQPGNVKAHTPLFGKDEDADDLRDQ